VRIFVFMRKIPLLLAIASPALLFAQFQQPTDEELKMTSDPKAPGAAAVYLNIDEVTDDEMHFHSFYARIKVLEEKGKKLATVEIPYWHGSFKVTDIKARTIHADGTVVPLEGIPDDLFTAKSGEAQLSRMVFTLPSAEVGSILEYRYELRYEEFLYSSPYWEIQRPYFVHKAHYSFKPAATFRHQNWAPELVTARGGTVNALVWQGLLPVGTELKVDSVWRYVVDLVDIPPAPNEEWMPPIRSYLYRVAFYYSNATDASNFWVTEAKFWTKDVDRFAEPTKPIKDAVAGLIAPGDSDMDKAKKLYKAVQALENTDFSRRKGQSELKQLKVKAAKRAEDTWAQKSGTGNDIALLYLAMLRAAGLTAYDMKVVNRDQGVFDPGYMTFNQFNDDIVLLSTGGNELPLDPGQKMCPFLMLDWKHAGAEGVRQAPNGSALAHSPYQPYAANTLVRSGDLDLDPHGVITGDFRFIMSGQQALYWRQAALKNDVDEVKKQFDNWLATFTPEGTEAHLDHFLGLDDTDANLMAMVNVHGSLGVATARRLLVPGFFFETRGSHPFVGQEKRLEPVDMHYGEQISDQVVYHLPPGFTVEGALQDNRVSWPDHAVMSTKSKMDSGQITVTRTLVRAFTLAKPEEYQDLRGFYQKVAAADQQQLVLTTTPAAKGN
jgi:transglutaminase-like putative cysteine protease